LQTRRGFLQVCATGLAGAVGVLTVAACGGTVAATTDPVAWVDKVCGSLLPLQQSLSNEPQFDQNDPAAGVKALSDFLGRGEAAVDQALSGLDEAGPSPVPNGDASVARVKTALTTVRSSFDQVKTTLDKIDPNNTTDLITALPQAVAPLAQLSKLQDPTTDLQSSPELKAAAAKAPNCQTLEKSG